MNLDQELIFSYVEEDNIQRAYFRIHPLLTPHGMVADEALQRWPSDGCLRIVPDRAEQHTFKERMRNLGGWCVVDLTAFAPDANKIRTNKNYHPERGEVNQYILYSDAVHPLMDQVFYEVLEGDAEDAAQLAQRAITPRFYIGRDDTLWGPVDRSKPERPEPAAPAEAVLYDVPAPDGVVHQLLCVTGEAQAHAEKSAPVRSAQDDTHAAADTARRAAHGAKAARAEKPAASNVPEEAASAAPETDEELPIGQPLKILDQSRSFEETKQELNKPLSSNANLLNPGRSRLEPSAPAPKLNGTPLYRAPLRTATPQPKNKLQEVVSSQWRVIRNDPPAQPLPAGATMRQVENPVEDACNALRRAWGVSAAHTQLVDCILSLDGMAAKLEPRASKGKADSALFHAIQRRLQDIEAERLTALVQLDSAKADLEAFRRQAIDSASEKLRAELMTLEKEHASLEASAKQLREQITLLTAQRDELASRLDEMARGAVPEAIARLLADSALAVPAPGTLMRISQVSGEKVGLDEMLTRIQSVCERCGQAIERNHAIALLAAMAVSERVGIVSTAMAATATMSRSLASAMGWKGSFVHLQSMEQRICLAPAPVNATPAVLLTSTAAYVPMDGVRKLMLARSASQITHHAAYECGQWPILPSVVTGFVEEMQDEGASPVSFASLEALLDERAATDEEINELLAPMLEMIPPLAGKAMQEMRRFTAACAHWMDGGLSAAIDWAVMMWILPALDRTPKNLQIMQELLQAYPVSLAAVR